MTGVDLTPVATARHAVVHTVGRRRGGAHSVRVCFVARDGALHLLARRRDGRLPDWYLNLAARGQGSVEIDGCRLLVDAGAARPASDAPSGSQVARWMRDKYGELDRWHDATSIPVRLEVVVLERERVA